MFGQHVLNNRNHVSELLALVGRHNFERQVISDRAPIEQLERHADPLTKMLGYVSDHIGLGSGSEAEYGRRIIAAGIFFDESTNIAIVRSEVVSPFRDAMRFIKNPVSDLALLQDRPDRWACLLYTSPSPRDA